MIAEMALAAALHQSCVEADEEIRYQQLAERQQTIVYVEEEYEEEPWYDYQWTYQEEEREEEPWYPPVYESSDGLNTFTGVNYHDGRTETYYSSNVLYHYRTSEWTLDDEGFYRDAGGYYVVAASDKAQGETFTGSKGECKVYDTGCNEGVTDYYVNW